MSSSSVSAAAISKLIGVVEGDLKRLVSDGVLPKAKGGKFELVGCVRGYIDFLKNKRNKENDQASVARHLDMSDRNLRDVLRGLGIDWPIDSLDEARVAYIRDLREKAAGRGGDDQGALTRARIRDTNASANLREIQFFESTGQLVSVDDFEVLLSAWAVQGRSEVVNAMNKIIGDIEGANDVVVDRVMVDGYIGSALDAIGDYPKRAGGENKGDES